MDSSDATDKLDSATPEKAPGDFAVVRWIFLRGMGVVYFLAFVSVFVQVLGLMGLNGILPAYSFLHGIEAQSSGAERFFLYPTVFWFNCSDWALRVVLGGGALLSLLVVFGIATRPALLLLWFMYLSIVTVGGDFMSFQWDILLLEAGFLSIFFANFKLIDVPWKIKGKLVAQPAPSPVVLWLLRWLIFKLMLSSGCVKIMSGDATWLNLSALDFHYWTQPLPTPLAWFIAQMPSWFQKLSVLVTFFVEIIVPFFIFAPRPFRLAAACLITLLQLIIALTGNYTFFNLLTIILCIPLLDDGYAKILLPEKLAASISESSFRKPFNFTAKATLAALVSLIVFLTCARSSTAIFVPDSVRSIAYLLSPWYLVNGYGLFAVMTTERKEIVVEASEDGHDWQSYEFYFKPGDLKRAPPWVAPYQPRLDWQMWFAALGTRAESPWFAHFVFSLLKGSPEVRALLKSEPFSVRAPRFVRASLYDYHFTNFDEQRKSGEWWKRENVGLFFPVTTLEEKLVKPPASPFSVDELPNPDALLPH